MAETPNNEVPNTELPNTKPPRSEFGKRHPPAVPPTTPSPPVKRSRHVALLMMGTLAVGGGAYAIMPRESCAPAGPGMTAPSLPQTATECAQRRSSFSGGGGSGGSSRSSFFGGDTALNRSPSATSAATSSDGVTRGGFGSFARSFAAHFSGG
jgi:hypothetical protein